MSAEQTNIANPGLLVTSSDTEQTLITEPAVENSAGNLVALVTARRVSDGAAKMFHIHAAYKRDSGDAEVFGVSLLAARGSVADLISLSLVSATIDADGSDLRVRVTGEAATDFDWSGVLSGVTVYHG